MVHEGTTDRLTPFVAASAALHAALFLAVTLLPALIPHTPEESWGSVTGTGIKVGTVTSLPGISLPSPPVVRETAKPNQSKTLNPPAPAPQPVAKQPVKADIQIPARGAKPKPRNEAPVAASKAAPTPPPIEVASNEVPGEGGRIALPYGQTGGGGQAAFGDANFGLRFGAYVTSMTRAIEEKWRDSIATSRGTSQRVYVTFTLDRAGRPQDLQVEQSSGSAALDSSAQRAVLSARIPPLPAGYTGSTVDVRFYFEYQR